MGSFQALATFTYLEPSMLVRPLSNELQQKAEIELNENPDRVIDDLEHIKEWLAKQPHLRARRDDQWLLSFLRGCKFSLHRTKHMLELFYSVKTLIPEYFFNRDPYLPEIQDFLKQNTVVCLNKIITPAEPRIMIIRAASCDPEKIPLLTSAKASLMILHILAVEDDNFVISGQKVFVDLQNVSYKYARQINVNVVKQGMLCLQCAPFLRPVELHLINLPTLLESIYNMAKIFMSKKIISRIKLHNETDTNTTLHKLIPLSMLPKEYGGNGDSIDKLGNELKCKVESYRNWLLDDDNYGIDGTKTLDEYENLSNIFGMDGSFRKLNLD